MEYRERPEIDIEPKEFADLKKELKKAEGELCLPLITKGIDGFNTLTEKQQKTFLKLSIEKLKLGEWKDFKEKPIDEIINIIRLEIEQKQSSLEFNKKFNELYNKILKATTPGSTLQYIQQSIDSNEKTPSTNFDKIVQDLKSTFPNIPEDLTNKRINIRLNLPNQPKIFLSLNNEEIVLSSTPYEAVIGKQGHLSIYRYESNTHNGTYQYTETHPVSPNEFDPNTINSRMNLILKNSQNCNINISDRKE